jgi:hypothetical protein
MMVFGQFTAAYVAPGASIPATAAANTIIRKPLLFMVAPPFRRNVPTPENSPDVISSPFLKPFNFSSDIVFIIPFESSKKKQQSRKFRRSGDVQGMCQPGRFFEIPINSELLSNNKTCGAGRGGV